MKWYTRRFWSLVVRINPRWGLNQLSKRGLMWTFLDETMGPYAMTVITIKKEDDDATT